ncbi:MAG: hypothetical protein AB7T27_02910 [Kiritimatiellia bacterium]
MSAQNTGTAGRDSEQWVKQTRLVRDWERKKQDILAHKWYESERAGHDVGWDHASVDWLIRHGIAPKKQS